MYSTDGLSCDSCTKGFGAYDGSACTACTNGETSADGDAACAPCASDMYSTDGINCDGCTEGFGSYVAGTGCTACTGGEYSANGDTACDSCTGNKYSSDGINCDECAAGFEDNSGTCDACNDGETSVAGGTCTSCTGNTWSTDHITCDSCFQGYGAYEASDPANPTCTQCSAGESAMNGDTACSSCTGGEYSTAGAAACSTCANDMSSSDGVNCDQCAAGFEDNSGTCDACNDGETSIAGGTCTSCSGNTWSTDHITCDSCFQGYGAYEASDPANPTCTQCNDGEYSASGDTACSACSDGEISAAGDSSCAACTANTWSLAHIACDSCAGGYGGYPTCTQCLADTYAAAGNTGTCTACDGDETSVAGSSSCSPDAGSGGSGEEEGVVSTSCTPGQYYSDTDSECKDCPSGCPNCLSDTECNKASNHTGAIVGAVLGTLCFASVAGVLAVKKGALAGLKSAFSPKSAKYNLAQSNPTSPDFKTVNNGNN